MERLTGKQAQNMMEALASVYDVINEMDERSPEANAAKQEAAKLAAQKRRESQNVKQDASSRSGTASDYRSQGGQVQHMGRDIAKPDASGSGAGGKKMQPATKKMQPASSAPTPSKRPDKPSDPVATKADPAPTKKSDRPAENYSKNRTPVTAGGGAPEEDGQVDRYRRAAQERARKNRGNMSEGITSVVNSPQDKVKGPAPTPGRSKTKMGPGKGGKKPTKVGLPMKREDVDVFDIVKGHLIDEGLTEEEALKKMLTLTDDERSEIIEGSCGSKKKKSKKKGGY